MTDAWVRPAEPQDLPRIWELMQALAEYERMSEVVTGTPEQLQRALFGERPVVECLVAESEDQLVGYAIFYPRYSSFRTRTLLWLEDLFVDPDSRGSGAGKALVTSLARIALARGCARIDWHVLDWNTPAIGFYEHLGAMHQEADWLQYGLDESRLQALAGEVN